MYYIQNPTSDKDNALKEVAARYGKDYIPTGSIPAGNINYYINHNAGVSNAIESAIDISGGIQEVDYRIKYLTIEAIEDGTEVSWLL